MEEWKKSYMEYGFKAWFYQKNRSQYFQEHIWNRVFHWNFVTYWCIQKRYVAKLLH